VDLLQSGPGKILLIASRVETVLWLEEWLRHQCSVRMGIFHEDMEIVERDRQAAWFAQPDGAQILLCSEIGGEGRNFQFAHRLVLWDRPLHPDLLEQRIGRLDRIGQKVSVVVYVPYFEDTPEEVLVQWYHQGLDSFTKSWNGGPVWEMMEEKNLETCRQFLPQSADFTKRKSKLKALIKATAERAEKIRTQQRESVDTLIDLNSFDEKKGHELVIKAQRLDADPSLRHYMEGVFEYFGVETEDFDGHGTLKVSAHSLTFVENFPGLTAHGERLITYDRNHALAREELALITWDHPMTQGALSLILEGKEGKASAATWLGGPKELPLLVELLFVLQVTAPAYLEVERYLPPLRWRVVRGPRGEPIEPRPLIDPNLLHPFPPRTLAEKFPDLGGFLSAVVEKASAGVVKEAAEALNKAAGTLQAQSQEQLERLRQLSRVNPLVTPKELRQHEEKGRLALAAMQQAPPRLDAIRLVVVG
jgi:ATP-dependent helicase HepA